MFFICDFWLIYNNTLNAQRKRETQACGLKLNDGGSFLLETVNLISQHSSRNIKSNSARAALSISCLAAQVDKCTAELINSAYILDAPMQFFPPIYLFLSQSFRVCFMWFMCFHVQNGMLFWFSFKLHILTWKLTFDFSNNWLSNTIDLDCPLHIWDMFVSHLMLFYYTVSYFLFE